MVIAIIAYCFVSSVIINSHVHEQIRKLQPLRPKVIMTAIVWPIAFIMWMITQWET